MADVPSASRLEIAHVLFLDIVGYSKFLTNEQSELFQELNHVVRGSAQVTAAEAAGKLIRLPTGDGVALAFFTNLDAPVRCACELSKALRGNTRLQVRMGVHSGPVDEVLDLNERANIAGAGITMAQRVMDCGDAGHILLSARVAEDLSQFSQWRPYLRELGQCEVKHGVKIRVVNFCGEDFGNPATPRKLRRGQSIRPAKGVLAGAVLGAALLVALGGWWAMHRTGVEAGAHTSVPTIAVLPFKPLLASARDQVLELGMADSLITKLSSSGAAVVSSLNAVRKFNGLEQDPLAAGRELKATAVLEGSLQKAGDRIRVTARLLSVADGASLWAGSFDEKFTDVFTVQDLISQKVADAVGLRLSDEAKKRITRRDTANLQAYQLYLTGRYHYARLIPSEIRTSMDFFRQAISLDPNYALAYFGLAEANRSLSITADVPSLECLPQSKAAAQKAIDLDPALAEPHATLAFVLMWLDWNWAAAEREAKRALQLNPNSAFAYFAEAHVLSDQGRHEEALAASQRAIALEPTSLIITALRGMFLHHADRNAEAEAQLQQALALEPGFWITHLTLGKVFAQEKRYDDAIREFEMARQLSHGNSEAIACIGYAAALNGDRAKATAILHELETLRADRYCPPVPLALVQAGLGNDAEALHWLEVACDERDVRLTLLKVDPRWNSLRSNPRFAAILARIGLN